MVAVDVEDEDPGPAIQQVVPNSRGGNIKQPLHSRLGC
jgi:hypothetical protein